MPFLGDDVGDVVAIDHHRREIEIAALRPARCCRAARRRSGPACRRRSRRSAPPACGRAAAASARRAASRPAFSQASLAWRRPCGSEPMFGAPPKPAMRSRVTVELVALQVDLQGRADEQVGRVEPGGLAVHAVRAPCEPSRPVKKMSGRARIYVVHARPPTPKLWTCCTQPVSIAGIRVGCGFRAKWVAMRPFRPSRSA